MSTNNPLPPSPSARPTIVAGIGASWTGSVGKSLEHAELHQFFAIDIDLRSSLLMPAVTSLLARPQSRLVRIRSAWVPGSIAGPMTERRTIRLWEFLQHAVENMGLRTVVMPRSSEVTRGDFLGAELRKRLRETSRGATRLAIGVKGSIVYRGHDQLAQLQTLRHTAEEWDLDIALDLAGDVPHYLEAEAAVLRLLPRLSLVRIPSWVSASGELNTADPISRRVVAILADQGYSGEISIVPARTPFQLPWSHRTPSASDEWTRTMILDHYDRQHANDRPSPYISPEIFREQH